MLPKPTNLASDAVSLNSLRRESRFLLAGCFEARQAARGWDIHTVEQEWAWMTEPPRDTDAAFIGFFRKWSEKRVYPS